MVKKVSVALVLLGSYGRGAQLTPAIRVAFEQYASHLEARLAQQHTDAETYLAALSLEAGRRSTVERRLISGDILVEPVNGGMRELPGALLHHWRAAAFVAGATPEQMLGLLRDYGHLMNRYAPKIDSARALKEDGDTAILAVRLKEQRVLTVVLDAEYQVESHLANSDRGYSLSRSTHIWQVENPGTSRERRLAEGADDGILWRLNSYWSFARTDGGLLMECEAVSLTRDVPAGLGWLITPVVQSLPGEALQFSLKATRDALLAMATRKAPK